MVEQLDTSGVAGRWLVVCDGGTRFELDLTGGRVRRWTARPVGQCAWDGTWWSGTRLVEDGSDWCVIRVGGRMRWLLPGGWFVFAGPIRSIVAVPELVFGERRVADLIDPVGLSA